MTGTSSWAPTAALVRGVLVGAAGLVGSVAVGRPSLLVLTAPLLVAGVAGLVHRPSTRPVVRNVVDHASLREGQAVAVHLQVDADEDVEQVTRVMAPAPFERAGPAGGRVIALRADIDRVPLVASPRRWGLHTLGEERVALTSGWGGYRYGPVVVSGRLVRVLPATSYHSRAEAPRPRGLVGAHRSARPGSGTEPAGIRAFQPGDRLRRVNWRVSLRTDRLHVTTTRAEQDAGLLLLVDLVAEHGWSQGVDGRSSSLDVTVRAAAALAEHAVATGDRVAMRPVGGRGRAVPSGTGRRHLRRLLGTLADVRTGSSPYDDLARLSLRVGGGTTVVLLSPLMVGAIGTTAADLVRRGVPTVVIDTLPPDATPDPGDADPALVDIAWRMRQLERDQVLRALQAIGCPVVAWRGAGTVDDLMRRLARHRPVSS